MTREVSEAIAIQPSNIDGASLNSVGSPGCNFSYINVSGPDRDHLPNGDFHPHENGDGEEQTSRESATPLPIDLLLGEIYEDSADFEDLRVVLTNFRLCMLSLQDQSIGVISLMSIESLNFTDPVFISIVCKDGKVYRLSAPSNELAIHWHKRLMKCTARANVGEAFAWSFASAVASSNSPAGWLTDDVEKDTCQEEWKLLGFDPDFFKISDENNDFSISETYPRRLIVPKWMERDTMCQARDYRFLGRFPAIVYLLKETKAVLLRSSQPKSGFLNWRCAQDEQILETVNAYTKTYSGEDAPPANVIMDARSYAAAWANRAKGGGFENPDCYGNTKSTFLGLPNIHNVRYAFVQLRNVLSAEKVDQNSYLQSVSTTQWLQYLSGLMSAASDCVDLLSRGTSVLVHCSDGWDRTSQIVSLTKLLADERYRTMEGFELLIRREWVEFGHKFADRNAIYGNDTNERCPVFLQWLDAVWQVFKQYPTAFEFNSQYIIKLAQHVYSGLFGTFLFNSMSDASKEMEKESRTTKPISIWQFLGRHNEEVVNQLYDSSITGRLTIQFGVQNLTVWREFYCTDSTGNHCVTEAPAVFSSPTLARAPATSPMKESCTMQKSKSSESISSIGNSDITNGALATAHSESNGTLNTAGCEHHPLESSLMGESMLLRNRRSIRSRKVNIKDLVDNDGMIKYPDAQQETARRKNKQHKAELKLKDELITDMKRQRSSSERTSQSLRSRDRMISGDLDSDIDNMSMDRAMSDMSLVDNTDVVLPASTGGWTIGQDACALCKMQFSNISLKLEDRRHHCRHCGKTVCDSCSKHTFHSIHEGRGVQQRACRSCYEQMLARGDSLNEEDEDTGRPRSRTDTMMRVERVDNDSFLNGYNTTQTVKG